MSTCYNYFLGYMKDDMIFPLGPYDSKGKLRSINSSVFGKIQDKCIFTDVKDSEASEELHKEFDYESNVNRNKTKMVLTSLKKAKLNDLPSGDFIKRGYFLMSGVTNYESSDGRDFFFHDYKSPSVFSEMIKNENQNKTKSYDYDGEPVYRNITSDYMYFAYPDYSSEQYESFVIKTFAESLRKNEGIPASEIVVLYTETKTVEKENYTFVI